MNKSKLNIQVGTSGWYYNHWKRIFYPEKLPKNKWFDHYAEHFNTVELNNTFYHQPKPATYNNWYARASKDFIYTVKANRYITHIKRLKDAAGAIDTFFKGALLLKEKLGPVLYQLPPNIHINPDLVTAFAKLIPEKTTAIFEFRHKSWFEKETFELLNKLGIGFCIHDLAGVKSPKAITSGIIYIRFHGAGGRYAGNYPNSVLKDWANWIKENQTQANHIYIYFNNDLNGSAVNNALQMKKYLLINNS